MPTMKLALEEQEELTFSDEEIDAFLPNSLRRSDNGLKP